MFDARIGHHGVLSVRTSLAVRLMGDETEAMLVLVEAPYEAQTAFGAAVMRYAEVPAHRCARSRRLV